MNVTKYPFAFLLCTLLHPALASAAYPQGTIKEEITKSITYRQDNSDHGRATLTRTSTFLDETNTVLETRKNTAQRISIGFKGYADKTPVSTVYYGTDRPLPEAQATIHTDFQNLNRLFASARPRSFIDTSQQPDLKKLAKLTKDLSSEITIRLEDTTTKQCVCISLEKTNETFFYHPGIFYNLRGPRDLPVTRAEVYGTTFIAPSGIIKLAESMVVNDGWTLKSTLTIIGMIGALVALSLWRSR